jgi:hypothetical protein
MVTTEATPQHYRSQEEFQWMSIEALLQVAGIDEAVSI